MNVIRFRFYESRNKDMGGTAFAFQRDTHVIRKALGQDVMRLGKNLDCLRRAEPTKDHIKRMRDVVVQDTSREVVSPRQPHGLAKFRII
jgi:hypothetical protein